MSSSWNTDLSQYFDMKFCCEQKCLYIIFIYRKYKDPHTMWTERKETREIVEDETEEGGKRTKWRNTV